MKKKTRETETKKRRSDIMRRVKSENTRPEMKIRKLLFGMGYRYRLHRRDLPGKPDIVFPGRKKAIFVHGCFWHGHDCRAGKNRPASNKTYWTEKLERNMARDRRNQEQLAELGWSYLIVWECEIKNEIELADRLAGFLKP